MHWGEGNLVLESIKYRKLLHNPGLRIQGPGKQSVSCLGSCYTSEEFMHEHFCMSESVATRKDRLTHLSQPPTTCSHIRKYNVFSLSHTWKSTSTAGGLLVDVKRCHCSTSGNDAEMASVLQGL
jgi:hypothetical protein